MYITLISAPRIIIAGDYTVKAGWTLGPRTLSEYELVYFPVGSGTQYRTAEREYTLTQPCFVLTRPSEEHAYAFDPASPTRHLFIHFMLDAPAVDSRPLPSLLSPGARPVVPAEPVSLLPGVMKHILRLAAARANRWKERCAAALHMMLTELDSLPEMSDTAPPGPTLPPQISRALHYIDNNLHLPLSIAEIAGRQGWTHEHFSRTFVKLLGISPQQAIVGRRIERACQLLVQTELTAKQIAYTVGFHDEHYFYRSFLKAKGVTASEYRRQFSDPRAQHLAPVEDYGAMYPLNRTFVFPIDQTNPQS